MDIIQETVSFVKETLQGAEAGHDWFHIERVWRNTLLIAQEEAVDQLVVELGALLHDIADSKFHGGDETIGPKVTRDYLYSKGIAQEVIDQVVFIVEHISFKGGNTIVVARTKELDVVQDADRLDAIGAIGIARTFNYGGYKNRGLYDPEIPPNLSMTKEEYKKSTAPTINHFYEKLLLLKERMNTTTGKKLAEARHDFMEVFLQQFYNEWEGKV